MNKELSTADMATTTVGTDRAHARSGVRADLAAGSWDSRARVRAARLEALLGDPYEPANPHGLRSLLRADERAVPPEETEDLLTRAGLTAEFVPTEFGGRFHRADLLAQVLRPVFRRDVALGIGFGLASLFAASAVWAAGTAAQRERLAGQLLAGGRCAIVFHELAHANVFTRGELSATRRPNGYLLNGRKDVIINATRAQSLVAYARTDPARGPRGHTVLLLDPEQFVPGTVHRLPRVRLPGMRGVRLAGLRFADSPVSEDALVGRYGEGLSLALRTYQVNRSLICGTVTAAAGTVLHSAVRAATADRTRPVDALRHKPLAGVFADLLVCDAMARAALRALSLLPDCAHLLAAATKYVVPGLLREGTEELATVLGAHVHERADARYGAFAKLVRDLPAVGLGHAGTASCQSVIVPQLRALAERSWFVEEEPSPGLFRTGAGSGAGSGADSGAGPGAGSDTGPGGELPALDYRLLGISGGGDPMAASLVASAARLDAARGVGGLIARLAGLARGFVTELRALREACCRLPPFGASPLDDPAVCALCDRYCLVAAAAAVLGTWEGQDGSDPFLSDPAWAVLALERLGGRLGIPGGEEAGLGSFGGPAGAVLDELVVRFRAGVSYDLDAVPLGG
ncbi:acyl-CoA dehydrogenase [Streptomyces sp. KLOTTS4A1]|uniref:acyl-CoA dehydrogenase n=1 Tax=Streptomyces sp. KLOTTS4A1 TaxID=3390996 RepID=UPI0039F562C4